MRSAGFWTACLNYEYKMGFRPLSPNIELAVQGGVINDLVLLSTVGILPVLVHGGGPEINQWLKRVGIESKFDPETGLRVTDGGACLPPAPVSCKSMPFSPLVFVLEPRLFCWQ